MFNCEKCGNLFRDRYNLTTHQSRIRPCVKENITNNFQTMCKIINPTQNNTLEDPNSLKEDPNSLKEDPNSLTEDPNSLTELENNTCKYCLHTFSTKKHINRHLLTCKYLDDPIRLLEIENDIIPELPESKTECRFCNKIFSRTDNLNTHITICKERKVYHKILIKEKEQKTVTINNTNNCNITNNNTNNQLILNFGQENLTHIQTENIINLLRDIRKEFGNDQVYLMAGNLVTSFDKYIRETPENNNFRIHDSKCLYAEVRIPGGWEKTSIDRSLNKAFKNSANQLYNKKEEINIANGRVFASEINQDIFSEIKQFSGKGFEHSYNPTELRKILTGYKISKLKNKNKNEIDF